MTIWDNGVAALTNPQAASQRTPSSWRPGLDRIPILVMGSSGAGKTEVWRKLTGAHAPDRMSTTVDQGYVFRSATHARRKRRIAITTVPGQTSRERFQDLDFYFDQTSHLAGIIFVATFGFDHVWPHDSDLVASALNPFDIAALRSRNSLRELSSFAETCARVRARYAADRNVTVPWILVLANKADLYSTSLATAEAYYRPGCLSPFDAEAERLRTELGTASGFRYEALPVSLRPADYRFVSNIGSFSHPSQLGADAVASSVDNLIQVVEELTHV